MQKRRLQRRQNPSPSILVFPRSSKLANYVQGCARYVVATDVPVYSDCTAHDSYESRSSTWMGSEARGKQDSNDSGRGVLSFFRAKSLPDVNAPGKHMSSRTKSSSTVSEDTPSPMPGTPGTVRGALAQLNLRGSEASSSSIASLTSSNSGISEHRLKKFHKILDNAVIDIEALRELCWSGIPPALRPLCWRLLLGYLPPNSSRQAQTLARKRREYQEMVPEYYDIANCERSEEEVGALRQVSVDVPRTAPNVPLFHHQLIQKSLERMLYIWGIRHPASGYVQGMNDLVTPFFAVFLSEHLDGPMETWCLDPLTEETLLEIEADCYWCLCKMLECIQDHYTYAQPGIQRTVFKLKELIRRIREPVAVHLEEQAVDFLQFAFRWVNCLLIREVPFQLSIRLWDTYLSEGQKFSDFVVYVCAAFLLHWSDTLTKLEFQDLILFLQKLPTVEWDDKQMEYILSQAFIWRASFDNAQSHLK